MALSRSSADSRGSPPRTKRSRARKTSDRAARIPERTAPADESSRCAASGSEASRARVAQTVDAYARSAADSSPCGIERCPSAAISRAPSGRRSAVSACACKRRRSASPAGSPETGSSSCARPRWTAARAALRPVSTKVKAQESSMRNSRSRRPSARARITATSDSWASPSSAARTPQVTWWIACSRSGWLRTCCMRCASGSSLASAPINTSCALVRQERSFTGDDVGKTANPPRHFSRVAILYEEGCPTQDVCSVIEPTAAYRTACQMQNATTARIRPYGLPTGAYLWLHEERDHRLRGRKQDRQRVMEKPAEEPARGGHLDAARGERQTHISQLGIQDQVVEREVGQLAVTDEGALPCFDGPDGLLEFRLAQPVEERFHGGFDLSESGAGEKSAPVDAGCARRPPRGVLDQCAEADERFDGPGGRHLLLLTL